VEKFDRMIKMRYHKNKREKSRLKRRALMARFLTVTKFKELPRAQRNKNYATLTE